MARPSARQRLRAYLAGNVQVLRASLARLAATPLSSLMTAAVIGIALALPTGLYATLRNLQTVSTSWDGAAQISVFLKMEVSDERARALGDSLAQRPEIAEVQTLSREAAMAEFRDLSGFGEALDVLAKNPLPAVLVIRGDRRHSDPQTVQRLVTTLRDMPETDQAKLDLQWVKRLYAIMEIGQRAVLVVGALLALAVLLVVGNTIRLEIENRRDEIVITKLIGATNAFIRRPFLYSGLWYGVLGGLIAWALVETALGLVAGPVRRLAGSYGSTFALSSLDLPTVLQLLGFSALLGLIGSWLAVSRHLSTIEPS
ncbi:MAG: cell division protein FtsX [Gammaproteobacteria bacterium]|nr:cell division protein FtsX [Gammaproteobacteria bacterium]NIR97392.1 cell division protein FtsX [Gammaproteobacteria bacterium]NIT63045.1 cell division protein FtsX [Gammaproteobacteria bacterium]NIV20007.1 cell division protein FtsX [Gammaproteobacteria bacterium]NIX10083.1 cell division protein FtsX [Gammaproteobacteria bacterium]